MSFISIYMYISGVSSPVTTPPDITEVSTLATDSNLTTPADSTYVTTVVDDFNMTTSETNVTSGNNTIESTPSEITDVVNSTYESTALPIASQSVTGSLTSGVADLVSSAMTQG